MSNKSFEERVETGQNKVSRAQKREIFLLFLPTAVATAAVFYSTGKAYTADATRLLPTGAGVAFILAMAVAAGISTWRMLKAKPFPGTNRQLEPKERMIGEIDRIHYAGNVCLAIGAFIAFCGVGAVYLAERDLKSTADFGESYSSFVMHLIPRLSMLLVIEFFAYFFLRIYRQTFDQMKFYHNELTTFEMRERIIHEALKPGQVPPPEVARIFVTLAADDRNSNAPMTDSDSEEMKRFEAAIEVLKALKR